MATKRVVGKASGLANLSQLRFNELANADKIVETGFDYSAGILGPIDTAQVCGKNKPVMVCNTAGVIHYVRFGDAAVAAPTGLTDGVMVEPNACMVLSSGQNTHVRSDSAAVGAYVAAENIVDGPDQAPV